MRWQDHSRYSKLYLTAIYLSAIPFAVLSFAARNHYSSLWLLLTLISSLRRNHKHPATEISALISMGDVFTILILTQFGPGPALISYWISILAAHTAHALRTRWVIFAALPLGI